MKQLKYGDLYTIDEFCRLLDERDIIPYDGYGYYSIGEIETNELVHFNTDIIRRTANRKGYTGVIWYNR